MKKIFFLSLIIIPLGLLITKIVKADTCGYTSDSVGYICVDLNYYPYPWDAVLDCQNLYDTNNILRCDKLNPTDLISWNRCCKHKTQYTYNCGTTMDSFSYTCVTNTIANLNNYQCLSPKNSSDALLCPSSDQQCCLVTKNACQASGSGRNCYDAGNQYNACKNTSGCYPNLCAGDTTICCSAEAFQQCAASSGTTSNSKTILQNPLGSGVGVKALIIRIIKVILSLVGALAVVFFIYGGLIWMTAGGSPDKVKKGRDILTWTILGLVIIFTSYIILNFVFESLGQVTK